MAGWILLYGINAYWLTFKCQPQKQRSSLPAPSFALSSGGVSGVCEINYHELPLVTVQLPIFNERYVARRLLTAICALDYPKDKLQIQVLDDSIDDTQVIALSAVEEYQQQGYWVEYIHRVDRQGYKAGALQEAMPRVKGDYIAIFDADFVPKPDWLKRAIQPYLQHPEQPIAVVQTRWAHLNQDYSLLTKVEAAMLDGHFVIEEQSRFLNNYFLIFHGTAGVWNRRAIIEAGGWSADTLAEDMDLSYRAQLIGWKIVYDNSIEAPAELPVTMAGFKVQQFRWNKGIAQCAKKFLARVWLSRQSLMVKLQATMQLTCCFPILMTLIVCLTSLPTVLSIPAESLEWRYSFDAFWGLAMTPASFGLPFLYATAQRQLYPHSWWRRLYRVLMLTVIGTGISINGSRAVLSGLWDDGVNFQRTPKFGIHDKKDRWTDKVYKLPFDFWSLVEIAMGFYCLGTLVVAVHKGLYTIALFMVLAVAGYWYVGVVSIWQNWQQGYSQKG